MAYSDPLIVTVVLSDRYKVPDRVCKRRISGKVADWRFVYL